MDRIYDGVPWKQYNTVRLEQKLASELSKQTFWQCFTVQFVYVTNKQEQIMYIMLTKKD